jgi:nucleoid-associated protein YgaU
MKIARLLPLVVLGLAAGCNGFPRWDNRSPKKSEEVLGKLEATQPAGDKLPEIVALPPVTPAPAAFTPASPAPTVVPAASKPEVAMKRPADKFEDDVVVPPKKKSRYTTRPVAMEKPMGGGKTYVVQRGDTLQKISQKFYGTSKSWQKIYDANKAKLKKPDVIVVGTTLKIP